MHLTRTLFICMINLATSIHNFLGHPAGRTQFVGSTKPLLQKLKRYYSTNGVTPVVPEKSYANTDLQKLEIIKENKGKAGIYR
jgi:hypothetical protein